MKTFYLTLLVLVSISTAALAQAFVNEIQIPPKITNPDNYHLNVIQTQHNFNPMATNDTLNTMIPTFAFEDADNPGTTSILGPTLVWGFGNPLTPTVTNNLPEVTTCHWHGAHVPQFADGGPHQRIMSGDDWSPEFEVKDKSATMWYHPHAMGLTYKHVQMGLSGMIIVEDPVGGGADDPISSQWHNIFPNEYEVDDFPLIFQTKKFERDGNNNIVIQADQGFKKDYQYMVNGIIDPYITLPASMVRLRLLNGDGKFSFNLQFENFDHSPFPAHMIATDAGYMEQTYEKSTILMAPGERTEYLLDLRGIPEGTELYIRNLVDEMPAGIIGNGPTTEGYAVDRDLLKIIVGPPSGNLSPIIGFPLDLQPSEAPPLSEVTGERTKTFRKDPFEVDGMTQQLFNIDSTLMDMMVVNDIVKLDSTEVWTIDNQTNIAHPWHIHDIHFWVTEILDENNTPLNPDDYPELFKGPKDNVLVRPGWKLSYITTFSDYGTVVNYDKSYMYHCHILPHEDNGMMGQFVVWNGEGNPVGIDEDPSLSTIPMTVYPNPAQDVIFVEGSSAQESILRFIDLNGRLVKQMQLPGFDGAIQIGTDQLPSSLLIIEWITKEGKAVSKIMIN